MGEWRIEWWEKEEPHDSSESMRREGGRDKKVEN